GRGKGLGDLAGQPLRRWVACHLEPQQLPPAVAQHQKREQSLKRQGRNTNKSMAAIACAWLRKNVFQPCAGDPPRTMYFETVDWATSKPSISSSLVGAGRVEWSFAGLRRAKPAGI